MINASIATSQSVTSTTLLRRCLVCAYRLDGLPAAHRCPECAFAFDEFTRVWPITRFRSYGGLWIAVTLILVALWLVSGNRARPNIVMTPYADVARQVLAYVILVVGILIATRKIVAFRSGLFVATAPTGLVYRISRNRAEVIPWYKVRRVCLLPIGRRRRVIVTTADGHHVDVSPSFRSETNISDFVLSVRARVESRELERPRPGRG